MQQPQTPQRRWGSPLKRFPANSQNVLSQNSSMTSLPPSFPKGGIYSQDNNASKHSDCNSKADLSHQNTTDSFADEISDSCGSSSGCVEVFIRVRDVCSADIVTVAVGKNAFISPCKKVLDSSSHSIDQRYQSPMSKSIDESNLLSVPLCLTVDVAHH